MRCVKSVSRTGTCEVSADRHGLAEQLLHSMLGCTPTAGVLTHQESQHPCCHTSHLATVPAKASPLPGLTFMRTSTLCLSASGDSHFPSLASWPASGTNRLWPSTSFRILTSWSCKQEVKFGGSQHIHTHAEQSAQHTHAEPSAHTCICRAGTLHSGPLLAA